MEQVVVGSTETPAAGPNDEALAAKGESAVTGIPSNETQTSAKERPEWVPEKFWNAETGEVDTEGMAKSYKELEQSRSKKPEGQVKLESIADAKELATAKGVDFSALEAEYLSQGDLSEETYKTLADKGIPEEQVKQFVEGQKAQATLARQELLKDVGGDKGYQEITSWAKESLSKDYIDSYNRAMATGDKGLMKMAIDALQAQYRAANGSPPKSQVGGKTSGSNTSVTPFESREQYVEAVKDSKYGRDPAYRELVMKRLQASNIF